MYENGVTRKLGALCKYAMYIPVVFSQPGSAAIISALFCARPWYSKKMETKASFLDSK